MEADGDSCVEVSGSMSDFNPIDIDPNGDVILEVGVELKKSLLVSSKVLSVASEVFRALFGPRFKEGPKLAERSFGETYKLQLKDDDPNAMATLCSVLHYQNQEPQEALRMELEKLVGFALLCDKYMCVEAVRLKSLAWLAVLRSNAGVEELQKLLVVCYFLDEPTTFNQISKQLVVDFKESFLDLLTEDNLYELLPVKILVMLEKERTKLRHTLEQGLQEPIAGLIRKELVQPAKITPDKTFGTVSHGWHQFCVHDSFVVSAYLRELRRLGIWPLNLTQVKVSEVLEKLHAFEEREIATAFGYRIFGRDLQCQACMFDPRTRIAKLIDKITSENEGVCLDCVKKGESDEVECRIQHD